MKEIIYFLPDEAAGVNSIVRNLIKYRPKSNHYYKVIFTRQIEREAIFVSDQFNVDEQIIFTYSKYENLYAVCRRLKTHISSKDSIIVSNDGLELRMVQLLKLPNPVVYIIHGDFNYYYGLVNQNEGIIDQYIAYSAFTKKQLHNKINTKNHSRVKLLYYPVPEVKTLDMVNKTTDLLFVGYFNERKGVQYLKQIYNTIKSKLTAVNFVIVGSGEMETQLKQQFSADPNVTFTGQLNNNNVVSEMQKAKVLLFPSLSEGLPNVVVEAMKAKCVPICSDIPSGIPDLIEDSVTGFRVDIGDTTTFSEMAVTLLNNDMQRKAIALNACDKATTMFQPYIAAKNYEEVILQTKPKNKVFCRKTLGGILNQSFLPNSLVKMIRKLNLSPKF